MALLVSAATAGAQSADSTGVLGRTERHASRMTEICGGVYGNPAQRRFMRGYSYTEASFGHTATRTNRAVSSCEGTGTSLTHFSVDSYARTGGATLWGGGSYTTGRRRATVWNEVADELEDVSYDDIIGIYRDRFADASDFAFYITGNYDEQRLRTLTERYIASLPATWRGEKAVDVGYHMARQPASVWFSRDMETPQSVVYVYRDGEAEYTPRTVVTARMLGSALANIYRREIREEKGWAYAIRTHCSIVADVNAGDRPHFNMPLNCPIEPGHEQECLDIVNARLRDIAENGLPADEMESVRRHAVKSARDGMDDNGYWASVLRQYHKYGLDFYNGYIETIEGVTANDIRRFVNDVVLRGNTVELIMTPVK